LDIDIYRIVALGLNGSTATSPMVWVGFETRKAWKKSLARASREPNPERVEDGEGEEGGI
jgi:hypothetical protein